MFPKFEDLTKKQSDLLDKDFVNPKKAPYTLKTKVAGPNGTKLTTTLDYLTGGALSALLTAEWTPVAGFKIDKLELQGKDGSLKTETTLTGGPLPDGLSFDFKANTVDKSDLGINFENDTVTANMTIDLVGMKKYNASVCAGTGPTTYGATVGVSNSDGISLDSYSVGATYSASNCTTGVVVSDKLSSAKITTGYTVNAETTAVGTFSYPDNSFCVGASYKCNPDTTIKVKVGSCKVINAHVKQDLGNKCTLVGMAAVKIGNIASPDFGASLTIG